MAGGGVFADVNPLFGHAKEVRNFGFNRLAD